MNRFVIFLAIIAGIALFWAGYNPYNVDTVYKTGKLHEVERNSDSLSNKRFKRLYRFEGGKVGFVLDRRLDTTMTYKAVNVRVFPAFPKLEEYRRYLCQESAVGMYKINVNRCYTSIE
jgi:hypothetical protein